MLTALVITPLSNSFWPWFICIFLPFINLNPNKINNNSKDKIWYWNTHSAQNTKKMQVFIDSHSVKSASLRFFSGWILPYKDRIYDIYISIQSVCEFYFRFTKQKCKRTIVNNTNSDFHKSKETGKNRREKGKKCKIINKNLSVFNSKNRWRNLNY